MPNWKVDEVESSTYEKCIRVKQCPLFIKEEFETVNGIKKRKMEIPDEWKVLSGNLIFSNIMSLFKTSRRNRIGWVKQKITDEDKAFLKRERERQKSLKKKGK